MDINKLKQWNVLEWEQQFRKEEKNISEYFKKLSKYIDLPDEDLLVLAELKDKKLLTDDDYYWNETNESEFTSELNFLEEEEEVSPDEESVIYQKMGANAILLCDFLSELPSSELVPGLNMLFTIGRMRSIFFNVLRIEEDEFPELKKALIKRVLLMINNLIGTMGKINNGTSLPSLPLDKLILNFHNIRERLIDLRYNEPQK